MTAIERFAAWAWRNPRRLRRARRVTGAVLSALRAIGPALRSRPGRLLVDLPISIGLWLLVLAAAAFLVLPPAILLARLARWLWALLGAWARWWWGLTW